MMNGLPFSSRVICAAQCQCLVDWLDPPELPFDISSSRLLSAMILKTEGTIAYALPLCHKAPESDQLCMVNAVRPCVLGCFGEMELVQDEM